MTLIMFLAVIALVAVALVAIKIGVKPASRADEYAYAPTVTLLTAGELAFQRTLAAAAPKRVCINSRVRLADIIKVAPETAKQKRAAAFNKIQAKHIDFVLCDADSMKRASRAKYWLADR